MTQKVKFEHIKTSFFVLKEFLLTHKKQATIISIIGFILAIGNGSVPFITGLLFDSIINHEEVFIFLNKSFPLYLILIIVLAGLQLAIAILSYKSFMIMSKLAFHAHFDYQVRAYSKLIELPLSFHKKKKMGDVSNKIAQAGGGFDAITDNLLNILGPQFLTIFVAIAFLIKINWQLSLVAIASLIIYLIVAFFFVRDSSDAQRKIISGWGRSFGDIHDTVYNTAIVKQSNAEKYEQKRIKNIFWKNIFPYWFSLDKIWQSLSFFRGLMVLILQVIIFLWSVNLVTNDLMTIGELIAFNSYLAMLYAPFTSLMQMWRVFQNGFLNISAVEAILNQKSENYEPENSVSITNLKGEIEFQNVYFNYEKGKKVLKNISFKVSPGEVVALVGKSGEGKSTLVDLLSAYHFPGKGKLLIDGYNIKKIPLTFLRSNIAVVPQEVSLFNDSIKKNIQYGNFKATDQEIESAAQKAHALEFIEKFPKKWKQMVGERGVKLSVGQKQRVAIARAILRNPKILILDEPTSALDAESENFITQSLNELMQGRTTFIIAHRLSTVRKADKILVFQDGKIVETGRHEELIKIENGVYKKLYELQIGLHE